VSSPTSAEIQPEAQLRRTIESRLDQGRIELPVLPEVAQKVVAATSSDNADVRQLATLVTRDQAMAAHVLRMANSAQLGTGIKIVSLQQALARLGMQRIRQIALQIACQGSVFIVPGRMLEVRRLFRHALATAFLSQEIARLRRKNVEEAYLAGLFHAVGKPILLQLISKLEKQDGRSYAANQTEAIVADLHPRTGALLMQQWGLPATLQLAVLHHAAPDQAGEAGDAAMMTNFGADLARFALDPASIQVESIRQHPMLTQLNFYPEDLEALLLHCESIDAMVAELGGQG
jgi:HD-like signal output (HDOD) protein